MSGQTGRTIANTVNQSGYTLIKAEVYLYYNHWHYTSGGTAIIRRYDSTTLSGTTPTNTAKQVAGWAIGAGKWVDITAIWSSAGRGVAVGKSGGTNSTYYGRSNGAGQSNAPRLRLTYKVNA